MTARGKFYIARSLLWAGIGVSAFCLVQAAGLGLGDPQAAIKWLWALFVSTTLTVGVCLLYYYYRAKRYLTKTQDAVAVETLAALGKQTPSKDPTNRPVPPQ